MAYVNKDNPNCANCNKSGLAILPVRYAVVPTIANAELPASLGNKVTSVALKHHKYALRTLRKGYLYLYYEKHARGRDIKWEIYSVSEGGTLWKQNSIGAIKEVAELMCSSKAHLLPASVITIDTPEKCGRVWMAFSEHRWGKATFDNFEFDSQLRDRRMQVFAPSDWINRKKYEHGVAATEGALDQVIEYKSGFALSALGGTDIGTFSQSDGTFDSKRLKHCSTIHPVTVRRNDKTKLIDVMKKAGETTHGLPNTPIIIALWDSVGIAHELNGFRNDAMGWVKRYRDERELELDAAAAIDSAKVALSEQVITSSRINFSSGRFKWDADATRNRLQLFDMTHGSGPTARRREINLCERWEQDAARGVPTHIASQRAQFTGLPEQEWQIRMAEVDTATGPVVSPASMSARDSLFKADSRTQQVARDNALHSWDAYETHINRPALDFFLERRKALCIAAIALADERTEDVATWLSSKQLQDALTEFNAADLQDGKYFTHTVGNLIIGIESSPAGRTVLKKWVDSASVGEENLLWRCFSFNQKASNADLNVVLGVVHANKEVPITESSLHLANGALKNIAKLSQLAQKGLSLHNALRTDGVSRIPTGGIEKILLGVGNLFLQPYVRRAVNTLSEGLIVALLLARSGSESGKIANLLLAMAKAGPLGRTEILQALHEGKRVFSAQFQAQKTAWDVLVRDADLPKPNEDPLLAGRFNESKQLTLGMIATIVQGAYVWKLYSDLDETPDNARLRAELWAAGFSLGAGITDLFATGTKAISSIGDRALTFQALKLAGGFLSAASAWYSFGDDKQQYLRSQAKGNEDVAYLYIAKGAADALSGSISILAGASYTEPVFVMLANKYPMTSFGRIVNVISRVGLGVAEELAIARALLFCAGIYVSVAVIAIQLLIWRYSTDALQDWCDRCAFGRKLSHRYGNAKVQIDEFNSVTRSE